MYLILLVVMLLASPVSLAKERSRFFATVTKTAKAKKPIYYELHQSDSLKNQLTRSTTLYVNPKFKVFASLRTSYAPGAKFRYIPDFEFIDDRHALRIQLNRDSKSNELVLKIKEAGSESTNRFPVDKLTAPAVASQGLIQWMLQDLGATGSKPRGHVHYLVPRRGQFHKMNLTRLRSKQKGVLGLNVEVAGFLGLFAPSFELQFDPAKRRLLTYSGRTNILDDQKEAQSIYAVYTHDRSPPKPLEKLYQHELFLDAR